MSYHLRFCLSLCVAAAFIAGGATTVLATNSTWNTLGGGTFNWDVNTNPPWNTAAFPGGLAGDIARLDVNISQNTAINLNQTIILGTLVIGDTGNTRRVWTVNTGSAGNGFIFDNGGSGNATLTKVSDTAAVNITADIRLTSNTDVSSTIGSLNLTGALLGAGNFNFTGTSSDVHLTGDISGYTGTFNFTLGGSTVTFNGLTTGSQDGSQAKFNFNVSATGTLRWADNATVSTTVFKMGELAGTGGYLRNEGSHPTTLQIGALNTSSTFAGVIANGGQPPTFPGTTAEQVSVEKVGSGALTLSGNNTYQGITTVTAGTLLVNGTHTGGAAYTVASGGILGGIGSIVTGTGGVSNPNLNAGVTVSLGGKLAPGASAGVLHMDLGTGVLDLSAAVASSNSQSMLFELDTTTTSDQVQLTNVLSSVNIGAGTLEFDDFAFTNLGGLATGTYTLFDSSTPVIGTLGSSLSGTIGAFSATIGLGDGGNDVVLTVVPEPSGLTLLGLSLAGLVCFRGRRATPVRRMLV